MRTAAQAMQSGKGNATASTVRSRLMASNTATSIPPHAMAKLMGFSALTAATASARIAMAHPGRMNRIRSTLAVCLAQRYTNLSKNSDTLSGASERPSARYVGHNKSTKRTGASKTWPSA